MLTAELCAGACWCPGSVEQQIGHKLHHLVEDLKRNTEQQEEVEGQQGDDADGSVDLEAALEAGERLEEVRSAPVHMCSS